MCSELVDPCCVSMCAGGRLFSQAEPLQQHYREKLATIHTSNSTSKMEQLYLNVLCLHGTLWER